jgi:hypothetical protein
VAIIESVRPRQVTGPIWLSRVLTQSPMTTFYILVKKSPALDITQIIYIVRLRSFSEAFKKKVQVESIACWLLRRRPLSSFLRTQPMLQIGVQIVDRIKLTRRVSSIDASSASLWCGRSGRCRLQNGRSEPCDAMGFLSLTETTKTIRVGNTREYIR